MPDQNHFWSEAADSYEKEFIDPYLPDVRSPLEKTLARLAKKGAKVVGDLGCGIGPLLPFLATHFETVHAVDFAPGMIARSRQRCGETGNITFHERSLLDLAPLHGQLDVAVAVNSLVMPSVIEQEAVLRQIRQCLKPGGVFLGILPAMDGVHYQTMLLLDRALNRGLPLDAARKNTAHHNDHALYDFAFGQFLFNGLEQHFWQPFEIAYRFGRADLRVTKRKKVHLSWSQFGGKDSLRKQMPPWDWFFMARPSESE